MTELKKVQMEIEEAQTQFNGTTGIVATSPRECLALPGLTVTGHQHASPIQAKLDED
eukprot:CAMPEP_0170582814 /NCGR_PEP_ID=MMETSP0224-20130122/7789_1 /TAXON_ID=285029 /ORGANISM="Togula jolla, Strain CCCM 725" /LENGTH=56 /DNA_ID=CAMNT_0010906073 /DNA_START=283 /DNA_END=454 /DNA_ORIENTATION=+